MEASPVRFLSTGFPRSRPAPAETETLLHSATPGLTLPEKTEGFVPEIFFTREFTCFRTVTLPNYLMMGGWHHDVVDMMVGVLTMTIVRNSEVF